jgi:glucosamine kinase
MGTILGVDAGGTKCDALLVDMTGKVLARGRCDVSHDASGRSVMGSGRSHDSVAHAVRQALAGYEGNELYVATSGVSQDFVKQLAQEAGIIVVDTTYVPEAEAALAQAGEDTGIVALAGTGAFVYGRTREGQKLSLDGQGPFVGDQGSAHYIGLMAMRAALQSRWHPRHHTSLAARLQTITVGNTNGSKAANPISFILSNPDRSEVAALAQIVDEEACKGDRIAQEILQKAAEALSETLWDVVDRLGMAEEAYPLVAIGGVLTSSDLYYQHFCKMAHKIAPKLRPVRLDLPAVVGVVLAGAKNWQSPDLNKLRGKLLDNMKLVGKGS